MFYKIICLVLTLSSTHCDHPQKTETYKPNWTLGPFEKIDAANPIMQAENSTEFLCPVRNTRVNWEAKDVFNPAAVVKDGKIFLLYRAEDTLGKFAGTSRIGLAWSTDGMNFTRESKPVLYPDLDFMKNIEWEGGCEDPRVVEDENGTYYMTYTGFNGRLARLCIAVSKDLYQWEKKGLAFAKAYHGKYAGLWCKSGAIVCRLVGEKLVATQINGKYWMYWGEPNIFVATSKDLINWEPVERRNEAVKILNFSHDNPGVHITYTEPVLLAAFTPRMYRFDSRLVEPGPPALLTDRGILLIYKSSNNERNGDSTLPAGTYAAGQALLDPKDPTSVIGRTVHPFFIPERSWETTGQVNNVCFLEGLAFYQGSWLLYYGTADSKIAVAKFTPLSDN